MKHKTILRLLIISLLFCSILIFCSCGKNPAEPEADIYDYSYIKNYRSDFDESKFTFIKENTYSRLLLIPNLISENEAAKLSVNTDTVISRICLFLNTSIKKEYDGFKGKVSYFLEPNIIPRCYSGSPIPVVSLTTRAGLYSMYNHETVHIFSMKTSALWLIEGLAVL